MRYAKKYYDFGGILSGATNGAAMGASVGGPAAPYAAIGGAIIGGFLGNAESKKAEREAKRIEEENKMRKLMLQLEADRASLANYPTKGITDANYYGAGGKMTSIAPNTKVVKGAKHEQGGVEIGNGNVVEGGEVIHKDKVFSDRLPFGEGSFADTAKKIVKSKGRYDRKTPDLFGRGTASRMSEKADIQLEQLFAQQEAFKNENGISDDMGFGDGSAAGGTVFGKRKRSYRNPIMGYTGTNTPYTDGFSNYNNDLGLKSTDKVGNWTNGAPVGDSNMSGGNKFGNYAMAALPLVDNIANYFLTKKSPDVPKPIYNKAVELETNFNINPALAENRRTMNASNASIDANTSNSNVGTARKMANHLEFMNTSGQLYGQKENIEVGLRNRNALNKQNVAQDNVAMENQYRDNQFNNTISKRDLNSANITNAAEDFRYMNQDRMTHQLDLKKIDLINRMYNGSGASRRNLLDAIARGEYTEQDLRDAKLMLVNGELKPIQG